MAPLRYPGTLLATEGGGESRVTAMSLGAEELPIGVKARSAAPEEGSHAALEVSGGAEDMWGFSTDTEAHVHALGAMHPYAAWVQGYEAFAYQPITEWQYANEGEVGRKLGAVHLKGPPVLLGAQHSEDSKPYQPGELLVKSAKIEIPPNMQTGLQWSDLGGQVSAIALPSPVADVEVKSECSTVDTAEGAAAPTPAQNQELPAFLKGFTGQLGMPGVPSMGSAGHHLGLCKPCAFVFKGGCTNGVNCTFCHLCEFGEKKRRKKEQRRVTTKH
mmetsp:Transcript_23600/g.73519  ORF Transcript_23600/g.73519 Transcript_23600/m.73519 type:complete len:273 (+) Transcript_23600:46-864(+)